MVSEPYLEGINTNGISPHTLFADKLNKSSLFLKDVLWSIEMKNGEDNVNAVKEAVEFVYQKYICLQL